MGKEEINKDGRQFGEIPPKEKEVKTKTIQASAITITDSLSSVKLTRTAGNEIRPEVKVYDSDPQKASDIAEHIMDKLNKKYKAVEK